MPLGVLTTNIFEFLPEDTVGITEDQKSSKR